jgi:MerR family transcriptional regulator, copper efflux regulator
VPRVRTYTIGEVAERSGFSASSLRYYEGIGLVEPMTRTDSGYRLYDDGTLDRLSFIARAKELGCSLDEITDLVSIWDGERCGPVQRRFHDLVTTKIADSQRRIAELLALTAELQVAAAQLAGPAVDGPCDDGCACFGSGADPSEPTAVALAAKPAPLPIACTLDPSAMRQQLAQWQDVLAFARARHDLGEGGLRIDFAPDVPVAEVARLATEEQRCCRFFSFGLTIDERGVGLEVRAPEEAAEVVAALFGAPA